MGKAILWSWGRHTDRTKSSIFKKLKVRDCLASLFVNALNENSIIKMIVVCCIDRLSTSQQHKTSAWWAVCGSEYILFHLWQCFWPNRFLSAAPLTLLLSPSALHYQAAADFAKARLPEALRQQLLTYERERERDREKDKEKDEKKERGGLSYPSILEQQILTLDREMLDKLSATYNEAGVYILYVLSVF